MGIFEHTELPSSGVIEQLDTNPVDINPSGTRDVLPGNANSMGDSSD